MNKKYFLIEEDFANSLLNYLAGKPYVEVFSFVHGLQLLKPIENKEEVKE